MGYNHGLEEKKFKEKWDKLRVEYTAAGMSEADIGELHDHDREVFNSDRTFLGHTVSLGCPFAYNGTACEEDSPLTHGQVESLSAYQPEIYSWGRHDWIDDLDTPELAKQIRSLSQTDVEVLSYLVGDAVCVLSRAEIARVLGVSRAAVTKRLNRVKSLLAKFRPQG